MSQAGYTPILIYSSSTASNAPAAGNLTNSTLGSELAINITDGKLFYKDNANAIQVIGWKTTPTTAGGTGLTSYTAGDTLYYASGTTLSKLAIGASKTIMTSSGTAPQWSASLDTSQGGTGNTSYTAGDMNYYASGTAFTKLAIGSAYQALQVNAGGTAPSWQPSATSVLTTQGDLLYASAANTLARLAKDTTASRYLSNSGTSNNPAWAQINLTNGVTDTLPTTNGGTGLASFTANGVVYASSTSALSTSSNMTFDGTNFAITGNAYIGSTAQINLERLGVTQSGNGQAIYGYATDASTYTQSVALLRGARNTTNATWSFLRCYNNADKLYIYDSGNVVNANNSYGLLSDVKLKENIVDATPKLANLMQVRIVNYNLKSDPQLKQIGVVAQELEQVFPSLVDEYPDRDADGNDLGTTTKSVKMSVFVPMLIKAIQELKEDLDMAKTEIQQLKA